MPAKGIRNIACSVQHRFLFAQNHAVFLRIDIVNEGHDFRVFFLDFRGKFCLCRKLLRSGDQCHQHLTAFPSGTKKDIPQSSPARVFVIRLRMGILHKLPYRTKILRCPFVLNEAIGGFNDPMALFLENARDNLAFAHRRALACLISIIKTLSLYAGSAAHTLPCKSRMHLIPVVFRVLRRQNRTHFSKSPE